MPTAIDLVFAIVVFVGGALLDYFVLWPDFLRREKAGERNARTRVYKILMTALWLPTLFILGRWSLLGRPWAALWLVFPHGWRLLVSVLAALAVLMLFYSQIRSVARLSATKRVAIRARLGDLGTFVPSTSIEHRWFMCLSVTAGVCEELLYRGFLVWALQRWAGLWWAAIVSVIAFAAAHAYQGKDVVRPAVVGVLLQGLLLLTGSILPAILVHGLLDVMSGTSGYFLWREPAGAVQRTTSSEPAAV